MAVLRNLPDGQARVVVVVGRAERLEVAVVLLYALQAVENIADKAITIYGRPPPPTETVATQPLSSRPLLHLKIPAAYPEWHHPSGDVACVP